ncbi:MAG: arsenite methyltransferase [Candidatus Desulforudis sp.]|nr:arsenite methyltransferase [Desulforudis sp.]
MNKKEEVKRTVREHYGKAVSADSRGGGCCGPGADCCGGPSVGIGVEGFGMTNYTLVELASVPEDAAKYSFGCGNPLAFSEVQEGQTVVDIGSGAGLDAIIAARHVGPAGRVIGLDMTPEMIQRARENVRQAGLANVTFLQGDAESMPLADETSDWVISNCVINLAPDKKRVFQEIFRILKPGGRMLISDMVAENLPPEVLSSSEAWCGCIAGAVSEAEYIAAVRAAGFKDVRVVNRAEMDPRTAASVVGFDLGGSPDEIAQSAAKHGTRVASIKVAAVKPGA